MVVAAAPAVAHDDVGGDRHFPSPEQQAHEFANVVAANAKENSNAPQRFAPCIRGMAADTYPCDRVDMMSHLTLQDLGLSLANDMWGWTDPQSGADYALIGGIEGTVFVDISDPRRPDVVGILPSHSDEGKRFWRDLKVYANHVFVVSEHTDHGMQVFDLTQLRGVTGDPVTFEETAHYSALGQAHNIATNNDSGYAYAVGTDTCDNGLHIVDISDPPAPTFAGCFSEHGNIHDTQCVIYGGRDADYRGREICFNSAPQPGPLRGEPFSPEGNINTLSIVDVTDKSNPVAIANVEYHTDGISHQGWLTPDQAYFLHGDEFDELFHGINTRTRIWDVRDLDAPVINGFFDNTTAAIDHNIYVAGDRAYASNYHAGLRIYDTSGVADGELSEVAFFDVYPENDDPGFDGTWSNYPYYDRGVVAVSSGDRGLFVLKPRGMAGHPR
jgi:choice-of-anchor B domain-containing protein